MFILVKKNPEKISVCVHVAERRFSRSKKIHFGENIGITRQRDYIYEICSGKCVQETEAKLRYNYNENSIEPISRVLEFKIDFRPMTSILLNTRFGPRYLNYTDKPYERGPFTAAIEVVKTEV
jgi:hypothetical protein